MTSCFVHAYLLSCLWVSPYVCPFAKYSTNFSFLLRLLESRLCTKGQLIAFRDLFCENLSNPGCRCWCWSDTIRYDQNAFLGDNMSAECLKFYAPIRSQQNIISISFELLIDFLMASNFFTISLSFHSFIHLYQHRRSVPVLHPPGEWFGRKHHTKPYTAFYNNNKQYVSLHTWISNKLNKNGNIKKNFSSIFIYSFRFSLIFSCNVVILIIHNAMVEKLSIHTQTHIIASYGSIQSLNI